MTRVIKGNHTTVVTGTDDPTKQVSKNAWNAGHSEAGMWGFTAANKTIASGALTPVDSMNIVAGEGALDDNLDYITYGASGDVAAYDWIIMISGAQTITIRHNQGSVPANSGAIFLLSGASKVLSATVPTILKRVGNSFYEIVLTGGIVDSLIASGAAIAVNKLAALTASRLVVSDGSGFISASSVTATEAGYLSGVTSAIQTQLNAKISTTLTSAQIIVGNGSNVATAVAMSGDATIDNAGAVTLATAVRVLGLQDMWIPAGAMYPRTTGGCAAVAQLETSTNKINVKHLDFDQTTQEFAQFAPVFARNYNNGTIKATPYWTFQSSSGGVVWGISGGAYSDDDALDQALGTAQTSTDTALTANDVHVAPQTSAITIAGSPADKDYIVMQVSRNPSDGSDTLAADAQLLGLVIEYTIDSAVAA